MKKHILIISIIFAIISILTCICGVIYVFAENISVDKNTTLSYEFKR